MKNPGWVDLQVNGHDGVDFSAPDLTPDGFLRATERILAAGADVYLPTLITLPEELCERNVDVIRRAVLSHGLEQHVPGVHLEGPYITAQGAHNPEWMRVPKPGDVLRLHERAGGFIRLMTLGADVPGAAEAIAECRTCGIAVSLGHHAAGYAAVHAAADAGAQLLTHLGNACPNLVGRHENPLLAGLAEPRLTAMVIADGVHLPPDLLSVICRHKGADGIIVTSDACVACGFRPGSYFVMGNDAVLTADGVLYNPARQCLIGSVKTISQCMDFLEGLGVFTPEELVKVGRTNALKAIGLHSGSDGRTSRCGVSGE